MNRFLAIASVLAFLVGLVHSVLGERLIFRRMRQGGFMPTNGARLIGEGHVRILWASWHALTVFGWCIGAMLFWLSQGPPSPAYAFFANAIIVATVVAAALVCIGTQAKHPGWVGLLGVAALTWLGTSTW